MRDQERFHGGGGICDGPWKTGRMSVGGGGMVWVFQSERAKARRSDWGDVFENAERVYCGWCVGCAWWKPGT